MRYYGAKTKLLPFIEEAVKMTGVNGTSNFVDLFAGTSAVGRHFKKLGYTVISNDTMEFSYAIAKTYIELNKEPQFKKLKSHLKIKNGNEFLFDYLNKLKHRKKDLCLRTILQMAEGNISPMRMPFVLTHSVLYLKNGKMRTKFLNWNTITLLHRY